jgi:hypothetical protein
VVNEVEGEGMEKWKRISTFMEKVPDCLEDEFAEMVYEM